MKQQLLTFQQTAKSLAVSRRTLRSLTNKKQITPTMQKYLIRFDLTEIERFLRRQKDKEQLCLIKMK